MKRYCFENFKSKEKYEEFIDYMLSNSDYFSLVYFKYKSKEKYTETVKEIRDLLRFYKVSAYKSNNMPSMITLNMNNHIYETVIYKADIGTKTALLKVNDIFDWDYPEYPMDLCFFKDGYAWVITSAHEKDALIYTDNNKEIRTLKKMGFDITFFDEVDNTISGKTKDGKLFWY